MLTENGKALDVISRNLTLPQRETPDTDIEIVRVAPGDHMLTVDWRCCGEAFCAEPQTVFRVEWRPAESGQGGERRLAIRRGEALTATLLDLPNRLDCYVAVTGRTRSRLRLFRCGPVPGVVVNYLHSEDYTYHSSGRSTCSPSIVRLPDGRLLASHDIYWARGGQNLTKIFSSDDNGETWRFLTDLFPCFWGKLFLHRGVLYMIGTSTEYGALLVYRSPDGGAHWGAPITLIEAGSRERGGPLRTPVPVVAHEGRLWTSYDLGSFTIGRHDSGVLSVPVDGDLMDPRRWTVSETLRYDPAWPGAVEDGSRLGLLEGNVVVAPHGRLVDILRYETMRATPDYGKAIMLNIDTANPERAPSFAKVIDFHGNLSKFSILHDCVSGRYWSLVNRVTLPWRRQRNIMTLVSSADLEEWRIEDDILNYQENGWREPAENVGFQYPDFIFEGEDLLALVRTALNGANSYHDANHITFHRIPGFRQVNRRRIP